VQKKLNQLSDRFLSKKDGKLGTHCYIGTTCTDFEQGRNAASIVVEMIVQLNSSL